MPSLDVPHAAAPGMSRGTMKRRITRPPVLIATSLILLAVVVFMGLRSLLVVDRWLIRTRDGGVWKIDSVAGYLSFERISNWPSPPVRLHTSRWLRSGQYYTPPFLNSIGL